MRSVFPIDFFVRYEKPVKLWRYPLDQHHVRKVERLREIADEVCLPEQHFLNKSLQDPLHAIWSTRLAVRVRMMKLMLIKYIRRLKTKKKIITHSTIMH